MKKILLFLLISTLSFGKTIGKPKAGEFLLVNPDLRSTGCGGTGVSAEGGVSSAYLNPASLIGIKDGEIVFIHSEWIDDLKYEFIGYGDRLTDSIVSLSLCGLHMPKIKGRKPNKEPFDYTAYDISVIFSYAKIIKYGALGINVKMIEEKIEEKASIGYGVDIGGLYQGKRIGFGASVANIGPGLMFIKEEGDLPLVARAGVSFRTGKGRFLFEIKNEIDENPSFHFGTELLLDSMLLRLGASTDPKLSYTAGFKMKYGGYFFDYVYALPEDKDELGQTHTFSLGFEFF